MKQHRWIRLGTAALVVAFVVPTFAQHEGHQRPGMASAEKIASCAQNSQTVSRLVDASNARIEEARQANDAAAMRAVVADLEVSLTRIKAQLVDCVALASTEAGPVSGSTPGMQHDLGGMPHTMPAAAPPGSPITALARPEAAAPVTGATDAAGAEVAANQTKSGAARQAPAGIDITFASRPNQPKTGENEFEVIVKRPDGKPLANADVSALFVMPAMPQMKMPEMRNEVKLKSAGDGTYSGSGQVMMAGNWNVTVSVRQNGKEIGQKKLTFTAK